MKIFNDKFRPLHGYEEGKSDAIDPASSAQALDYKKNNLKQYISLNPTQIENRMGGDKYFITKKYDGEYAAIFFSYGQTVIVNRSGRVRRGIPCVEEAGRLLTAAGVKEAFIPAEIYVSDENRKTRVNDLLSALANKNKISTLRLACFDIVELDGTNYLPLPYPTTWKKLTELFAGGESCHPVEMETVTSAQQVLETYLKWVENEGAEGLVVRTELPFVYKIKPRHNIDVVIVGFSEGTGNEKGRVRSLLTAFIPEEGKYQVVGRVGSGLKAELGKSLFTELSQAVIPSDYIQTDANYVAFHMVRPEKVIEISVNDLMTETVDGPKQNPVLEVRDGGFKLSYTVDGVKFLAPVFERMRDDKNADSTDVKPVRPDGSLCLATPAMESAEEVLSKSEILLREVYLKTVGNKKMLQKYLVWKTNKEKTGNYPAYVLCYVNFSTDRQEPLQREVRISDSREQIMALHRKLLEENIKKGWEKQEESSG